MEFFEGLSWEPWLSFRWFIAILLLVIIALLVSIRGAIERLRYASGNQAIIDEIERSNKKLDDIKIVLEQIDDEISKDNASPEDYRF